MWALLGRCVRLEGGKSGRERGKLVDFTNTLEVFASATVFFRYRNHGQQAPRMPNSFVILLSIQAKRYRCLLNPNAESERDLV